MKNNRFWVLAAIAALYFAGYLWLDRWPTTLYYGDSNGYYLHVVSFWVNQDVGDYGQSIDRLLEVNPNSADPREDKFGIRLTEKGRRYIKYTLGVPVMETPFFLLAHAYASLSPSYEADGWSKPYLFIVGLSTIVYLLLGFYLLYGVLRVYFSPKVTALTLLTIAAATNLFYHGTYVTMAHGFLFFDYCLLIWLSHRFYQSPTYYRALAVGAVVGLIALTRVPEVISAMIPLLWGVGSWPDLKSRLRFFCWQRPGMLLAVGIGLVAVFSLQLAYWQYVSGQWVFNPYEGEGFNFLKPRIHKGWFDFANGWLIYTPVMGLSLLGLVWLRRYAAGLLLPIALFVFAQAYIHYSYYAWTYFPGLGSRPMVETYPLLAFGLAACLAVMWAKPWSRYFAGALLLFFTALNLFQTWQMKAGIIWSERGNKAFYVETFGALQHSRDALLAYDLKKRQPADTSRLQAVKTLWVEGFETGDWPDRSTELAHQGDHALFLPEGTISLNEGLSLSGARHKDWLRVRLAAYMRGQDRIWNRDACADLELILTDAEGKKRKYYYIKISPHIGNDEHSIWLAGEPDQWGELDFFVQIPKRVGTDASLIVNLRNSASQKLFVDDISVAHYR